MSARRKNRMIFCAASALLLAAFGVSLCVGRYPLGPLGVLRALLGETGMAAQVFWRLRLPRTLAAALSGAALGLCGAVYQLLFDNALAAPDVMGVSGGATLGAAAAIVCFGGGALVAPGAFLGGMAALGASLLLTRASGSRGTGGIVLSGILISALCKTGIMLLKTLADTEGELAAIEFFTMGSFADATAAVLPALLAGIVPGALALALLRRQIRLLTLPDEEAQALGVRAGAMRALVLTAATLMASAVSAAAGVIAFLPLIAPHGARLLLRGRSRGLLPLATILGGALLLGADTAARLAPGAELPVSVFTTLLGVPMIALMMAKGACAVAEYLIEMDNLRAGYRGRDVLRGVRLRVREGEICALLGLNGSGKSTLLRAALGLIPAQADRLLLGGEDVRGASPGRVAQLAAYIPQRSRMDGGMTALEAVLLGANARMPLLAAYSAGQRKAARTCLTEAGAQALADCLVGELSEGQRQLVVLARALMQQPKALLLDEPDGALDLPRRYAMMRAVRRQAAQGRAALVALHDASLALTACDRVFILKEGQIFAELDMERADEAAVRNALRALYGDVTAVKIGEKWAVLGE